MYDSILLGLLIIGLCGLVALRRRLQRLEESQIKLDDSYTETQAVLLSTLELIERIIGHADR